MIIVFDMDDVLVNLNEAWIDYLNKEYNLSVEHEAITDWDMKKAFPSLSTEQLYGCLHTDGFWKTVKPVIRAKEVLQYCEDNPNLDYYIVTAALPKNFYVKWENCLKKYFPFIPSHKFVCCNNKKLIKCDMMVDDNPDNFPEDTIRIMIDKPWNRNVNPCKFDYVAFNLKSVLTFINKFIETKEEDEE